MKIQTFFIGLVERNTFVLRFCIFLSITTILLHNENYVVIRRCITMTIKEAAEIFKIDERIIRKSINDGMLQKRKIGRTAITNSQ